jgi:molybdopterin-binding protein
VSDRILLPAIEVPLSDGRTLSTDQIDLAAGERFVLYGPNGAGKSTTLRAFAGLVEGIEGVVGATYLQQRPYMFRGTARRNLALGLDDDGRDRAEQLAVRLGILARLDDPADQLSGGERSRLGLARALAGPGTVALFDEPLAALDIRDRPEVERVIIDALGRTPALIVTHNLEVAAVLSHRMGVMIDGRIRQVGTVSDVFSQPIDDEVAEVVGVGNVIGGVVLSVEPPLVEVRLHGGTESSPVMWALGNQPEGSGATVMFGAEAVTVVAHAGERSSARNQWPGQVSSIRPSGRLIELVVDTGVPIVALITPGSFEALELEVGTTVALSIKATAAHVVVGPDSGS